MNWKERFEHEGLTKDGHFVLHGGIHAPKYFDSAVPTTRNHPLFNEIVDALCQLVRPNIAQRVTVLGCGKAAFYAHQVAMRLPGMRNIRTRFAFLTRELHGPLLLSYDQGSLLRDERDPRKGADVIFVDDVHTTGATLDSVIDVTNRRGASIRQYITIVNRSKEQIHNYTSEYNLLIESLVNLSDMKLWESRSVCELCAKGIPISTEYGMGRQEFSLLGQPVAKVRK